MPSWAAQDKDIQTAAAANNCVMFKRRDSYIFCAFLSTSDRSNFKTAISGIGGIAYQDWPYPHDPSLYVERVVPV